MPNETVDYYQKRRASLRSDFTIHEDTFSQVMDQFAPRKGVWLKARNTDNPHDGQRRDHNIIDTTTIRVRRNAAAGLQAGITSPSRPWKKLGPDDPSLNDSHGAREFYAELDKRFDMVVNGTNLYQATLQAYADYVGPGPAALQVDEHDKDVFHCTVHPVGSWVAARNADGDVDVFYRDYSFTAHQLKQKFGVDALPEQVKQAVRENPYKRWDVHNSIEPNPDYAGDDVPAIGIASFKYLSVWWVKGHSEFLKKHGYSEFPVFVFSMYRSEPSDVYGYGAGVEALGDAKQLQHMQRMKLIAIDKTVNPPLQGPTSLKQQGITQVPGETNFHDAQTAITSLYNLNLPIQYVLQDIQETQQRLSQLFFEDLFLMITQSVQRQTTAREIEERHQEKLVMLGPVLESLVQDLLDPMIERVLAIMRRKGLWPQAPEDLQGAGFNVEYVSILATAQRAIRTIAIEQGVNFAASMAQVGYPEALDRVKVDGVIDEYFEAIGFPPEGIEEVSVAEQKRAERLAQQQQAENLALAQGAAGAAADATKADMTQPNILTHMLGQVAA